MSTCVLQLFQNDAVEFFAVGEFLEIVAFDAVLAGEFLKGWLGGDNDGNGFLLAGVGVAADVGDNGGGTVD